MRELPIPFQTEMSRAVIALNKTETRRTRNLKEIHKDPDAWHFVHLSVDHNGKLFAHFQRGDLFMAIPCPYGQPGDVLWVREKFAPPTPAQKEDAYMYASDCRPSIEKKIKGIWKPSIHMPKAAARIWLQVEEIRVERLKDITEASAIAEGIEISKNGLWRNYIRPDVPRLSAVDSYMTLIGSIITMDKVFTNPWVWVVKFKVLSTTGKPNSLNQ